MPVVLQSTSRQPERALVHNDLDVVEDKHESDQVGEGSRHTNSEVSRAVSHSAPCVIMGVGVSDNGEFMSELRARRLSGNDMVAGHMPPDLLVTIAILVICWMAC